MRSLAKIARATTSTTPSHVNNLTPNPTQTKTLAFGWDGTTALGGAVDDSKPARMLDEIRASGETVHPDAELFLQNLEVRQRERESVCVCVRAREGDESARY